MQIHTRVKSGAIHTLSWTLISQAVIAMQQWLNVKWTDQQSLIIGVVLAVILAQITPYISLPTDFVSEAIQADVSSSSPVADTRVQSGNDRGVQPDGGHSPAVESSVPRVDTAEVPLPNNPVQVSPSTHA